MGSRCAALCCTGCCAAPALPALTVCRWGWMSSNNAAICEHASRWLQQPPAPTPVALQACWPFAETQGGLHVRGHEHVNAGTWGTFHRLEEHDAQAVMMQAVLQSSPRNGCLHCLGPPGSMKPVRLA